MNDSPEMEPAWAELVERRRSARALPPYRIPNSAEIETALSGFVEAHSPGGKVSGLARLGSGASKEQFVFAIDDPHGDAGTKADRYVLRMDPQCPIIETDPRREFTVLNAMNGRIPAPPPIWVDDQARFFKRPALVTGFISGVTKPKLAEDRVSGMGTRLGAKVRAQLKQQFLDILITIHGFDWRNSPLEGFSAPDRDAQQAARWSFNFWDAIWHLDKVEDRPIMSLARHWLSENLPECDELVLTHGDFRTGNYLFDEAEGRITAVLDWELARIGDFHEDLAWIIMRLFGVVEDGVFRASDLYEREEFIAAYELASGRSVNRMTLRFYEILSSWKCYIIVAASALSVARGSHSHQDIVLTFMGAGSAMFAHDIAILMKDVAR